MSTPLYTITSLATGPGGEKLYLNADNFGNVTVQFARADTSLWSFGFDPNLNASYIINKASGQVLNADANNNTVTTTGLQESNTRTWTFAGGGDFAVRPLYNSDLNLNIRGNDYPVGTPVIIFKWDNHANSKWNVTAA
jgi:hypothetical protein